MSRSHTPASLPNHRAPHESKSHTSIFAQPPRTTHGVTLHTQARGTRLAATLLRRQIPPRSSTFLPFSLSRVFSTDPIIIIIISPPPFAETTMLSLLDQALTVLDDFGPSCVEPPPAVPEPDPTSMSPEELRRLRRLISNRESARRCRMRKQRRLEDLRARVSLLESENRDLANRLSGLGHRSILVCRDNDRLRVEASALGRRLADLHRVLELRHLHHLAATPPSLAAYYYEQAWASLIA